jgi:ribosomal protein L20
MIFTIHFPDDRKKKDKFKKLLIEAKRLSGLSYHRLLETAVMDFIVKSRKGEF